MAETKPTDPELTQLAAQPFGARPNGTHPTTPDAGPEAVDSPDIERGAVMTVYNQLPVTDSHTLPFLPMPRCS